MEFGQSSDLEFNKEGNTKKAHSAAQASCRLASGLVSLLVLKVLVVAIFTC